MSAKDTYKLKIEAQMKLAQTKITELKANAKNYKADALVKYNKHVDDVVHLSDAVNTKLAELGKASDDSWEKLQAGVDSAYKALDSALKGTADKFKHENTAHDTKPKAH
jgi:ElaB/YqjD/DUF883 family membrane-anchored ribosome-binding protein